MQGQGSSLLEMRGICKSFSAVQALKNVDLELRSSEVHALVGENGAGKSTLIKILTGIESMDSGTVSVYDKPVVLKNPRHARRLGIAAIFQELSQIPTLTVAENVFLGQEPVQSRFFLDRKAMARRIGDILDRYGIDLDPAARISSLPAAQRQLAEIVKAISLEPRILVMDEPTSSLTEKEAAIVFRIIRDFIETGAGVIYISHRMDEIFHTADRVTVLRDGNFIESRPIGELDFPKVVKLMVGREVELYESGAQKPAAAAQRKAVLEVQRLTRKGAFGNVSFTLYEGEILGIAGLVGSGRSELVEALFGIHKVDSGRLLLDGSPVVLSSVADAMNHGIALIPESRHLQGLVLKHTVGQNLTLPILGNFTAMGLMNYRASGRFAASQIQRLDIRPAQPHTIVDLLSGGNQQKVVISKWLAANPRILLIDEPTAGIDVHSKSEIHRLVRSLANRGLSVIMISSEMTELLAHSDRIMVMNHGRILTVADRIDQESIMSLIMKDIMKGKVSSGEAS